MVSHGGSEINTQLPKRPLRLLIAIAVVTIQAMVLWAAGLFSVLALFQGDSSSLASSLFLTGMVLAAAIWSSNISFGLATFRRWSHTAALVLQLIAAAIGTASLSGEFAQPLVGWPLVIMAATAFVALFNGNIRILFYGPTGR